MNLKNNNQLHFEPVNSENRREAENLSVFSEQSGFIESVGECLQEADNLNLWRPVCIYDGDTLVGFAMYGYFPSPFPRPAGGAGKEIWKLKCKGLMQGGASMHQSFLFCAHFPGFKKQETVSCI